MVWVGELLRAAIEGFKVKGLLLVKGDHFGKWSSVILTEHLTLSVTKKKVREKAASGCETQSANNVSRASWLSSI